MRFSALYDVCVRLYGDYFFVLSALGWFKNISTTFCCTFFVFFCRLKQKLRIRHVCVSLSVCVCRAHSVNALLFNVEFFTLWISLPTLPLIVSSLTTMYRVPSIDFYLSHPSASYANIDVFTKWRSFISSPLPPHNFLFLLGVLYLLPFSRTVSVYFPDVCCVLWSLLYYLLNICTYISIYLSTRWHCSMSCCCCCCCPRANCYTHLYVNASASVGDEGVEVGVGGWVCPWRASAAPVLLSCHSRLAIPSPFSIPLLTPWNVSTIG